MMQAMAVSMQRRVVERVEDGVKEKRMLVMAPWIGQGWPYYWYGIGRKESSWDAWCGYYSPWYNWISCLTILCQWWRLATNIVTVISRLEIVHLYTIQYLWVIFPSRKPISIQSLEEEEHKQEHCEGRWERWWNKSEMWIFPKIGRFRIWTSHHMTLFPWRLAMWSKWSSHAKTFVKAIWRGGMTNQRQWSWLTVSSYLK